MTIRHRPCDERRDKMVGTAKKRKRRRLVILLRYGDGTTAPCVTCGIPLTDETMTIDRIIPGAQGGDYAFSNCQPMCLGCNREKGGHKR